MKHAPVRAESTRQSIAVSLQRPITGPNGIAIAPSTYGIDFLDRQQSTTGGMPIQCQSREGSSAPERQKENNTGLPDQLKAGIETLSGISMSDVRVHTHSSAPARLNAHAYTQGRDIFVAPGQERHLPHEAWHVVQQAQGRVRETARLNSGVSINGDKALEREADVMGRRATKLPAKGERRREAQTDGRTDTESTIHPTTRLSAGSPVAQADIGFEFQTYKEGSGFYKPSEDKKFDDHEIYAESTNASPPWRVENDGGDLEVVVERIPVTEEGNKKLINTMNEITECFTSLAKEKRLPVSTLHKKPLKKSENWQEAWNKESELCLTKDMKAHPQVTAGVRLDKLLETFELIGKAQYQEGTDNPKEKQDYANQLGFYKEKKSQVHQETIRSAMAVGKRAAEAQLRSNLQGFLAIIAEYIIGWQKAGKLNKRTMYAKNYTPIMGRTNLATVFTQVLSKEDQEGFRNLVKDEETLKNIFGSEWPGLEALLFGTNVPDDILVKKKETERTEFDKIRIENLKNAKFGKEKRPSGITVGEFLNGLTGVTRPQSIDLSSEDYGPQAIGSQDTQEDTIIDKAKQARGIAVELRKLRSC